MLDILRANLYQDFQQELVFVVNHFKVGNNYAWFMGDAQRRDGQEIILPNYDYDCCHVEALFKKAMENGIWYKVVHLAQICGTMKFGMNIEMLHEPFFTGINTSRTE